MADERDYDAPPLPREPIHRLVAPFVRFLHIEAASGVVLLAATAFALLVANTPLGDEVHLFWETPLSFTIGGFHVHHSLKHWINDGLMALFFFLIGLEVKRELVLGELQDLRRAALPIAGAIGGMVVPAGVYLALQYGHPGQHGWGIPMATDIAFVVGCMAVLGSRVPPSLRVMLLSLAIADDIGAILVIAIGYTAEVHVAWLGLGLALIAVIYGLARLGARSLFVYFVLGFLVWFCFEESGVHATIAGVILGLMTPARSYLSGGIVNAILDRAQKTFQTEDWAQMRHRGSKVLRLQWATRETISPLEYLESALHPWVAFVIIPVFALANADVPITVSAALSSTSVAVVLGLVVGKPLGIVGVSWLATRLGLARAPDEGWGMLFAGGCLAGIGFTMALFISELALAEPLLTEAKIGVLIGSCVSAALGMGLIYRLSSPPGRNAHLENAGDRITG